MLLGEVRKAVESGDRSYANARGGSWPDGAPATVRHVESLATETPYSIHPARAEAHAIGGFEPDWRYAR